MAIDTERKGYGRRAERKSVSKRQRRKEDKKATVTWNPDYEFPILISVEHKRDETGEIPTQAKCPQGHTAYYAPDQCFLYCRPCNMRWTECFSLNEPVDV